MARTALVLVGILLGLRGTDSLARQTYGIQDGDRWRPVPFEAFASHLPERIAIEGSDRPYTALISTQERWEAIWRSAFADIVDGSGIPIEPPAPAVPFPTKSLLLITMGARYPYQGKSVRIEAIWESKEVLLVQVVETINACMAMGDTHPGTAVLIPHSEKQVLVDIRNEVMLCR